MHMTSMGVTTWMFGMSCVVIACGPDVGGGAEAVATTDGDTEALADSSSGAGSVGETGITVGTATTQTGTSGAPGTTETSGDDDSGDHPKLDVSQPIAAACDPSATQAIDLEITTPSGPFAAAYAWWAWEYCCLPNPRLVLTEVPELEVLGSEITTPHIIVFAPGDGIGSGPYVGPMPVALTDVDGLELAQPVDGFVLVDPLDPEQLPEGETPPLSATFAIDGSGWTMSGSVTAPYCGAIELPPCPCE